jgi:hypothetical protein
LPTVAIGGDANLSCADSFSLDLESRNPKAGSGKFRQKRSRMQSARLKRRIKWRIIRVMSVFDCTYHETRLHREFADCRYRAGEIQSWLGRGRCDGDSEIFALDRRQKRALLRAMDGRSWGISLGTWIAIGIGVGLIAIAAMIDYGRRMELPAKPGVQRGLIDESYFLS